MSLWLALNRCPICCRESEIKSQTWRHKTTCCVRVKILWLFWENNSTCPKIFSWSKMTYRTSKLNWIPWSRNGKMSLAICWQKWMRLQLPVLSSLHSWSTSLTNCSLISRYNNNCTRYSFLWDQNIWRTQKAIKKRQKIIRPSHNSWRHRFAVTPTTPTNQKRKDPHKRRYKLLVINISQTICFRIPNKIMSKRFRPHQWQGHK